MAAKEKPVVRLFPNPAKNKVEIEIKGFEPGLCAAINCWIMNGKLLKEEKRLVLGGNEIIVFMFSEKPGLYYILLKQGTCKIENETAHPMITCVALKKSFISLAHSSFKIPPTNMVLG